MTYLDQLEEAFAAHFAAVAERRSWGGKSSRTFPTGAFIEFVSGNIRVRLVNDRRLMDVELGPVTAPSASFTVSQLKDLLEPPRHGQWRLSLSESAEYLDRQWDLLNRELAPTRVTGLLKRLSSGDNQS